MDFSESMKIVSSRIQEIEPEHACKIVGYLLLQECGDQDMIRLAFSPDNVIKSVTNKVKHILGLVYTTPICPQPNNPGPISDLPVPFNPYLAPSHSRACWNAQAYIEPVPQCYVLEDQFPHALNLDERVGSSSSLDSEFYDNRYYPEPGLDRLGLTRASRRSHSLSEFPPKVCHCFNKGFCKHGANCKYLHGNAMTLEGFSQSGLGYNENRIGNGNVNGNGNDENMLSLWSLKNLEVEIIELLRSRKGNPISIASLPTLYGEKYGRILQAEGYLTESQRHGRAGFSLTKLLSWLNNICLIDRPHGQHSVILVEDAHKYLHYVSDQNELGGIVPGSRQVYLTFPADSTFTENDVSSHFNTYGPVQDVRIPCQQKRMFGFVTFVHQETAKKILSKANPHFVCGSRVLVKPYREKSRLMDRKYAGKLQHSMHYNLQSDGEHEFHSLPRAYDDSRLMRQRFMEERNLSAQLRRFSNSIDELNLPEEFPTSEQFNSGSSNEEMLRDVTTSCSDQESNEGLNLPDNPFRDFNSYQHYPTLTGASTSENSKQHISNYIASETH